MTAAPTRSELANDAQRGSHCGCSDLLAVKASDSQKENHNELHLFAGAGGGILGGILLGHTCVCAVEIEPYARQVLLARQRDGMLPIFPIWDDVRTFDGRPWRGIVRTVCGGFPCQDISAAGTVNGNKGLDGERSGLWSEMRRIVCEVSPQYVFVENSPMLTLRGLGRVLGDLAEMGYDARWGVLGALDAGAPHERERIWILADAGKDRWLRGRVVSDQHRTQRTRGDSTIWRTHWERTKILSQDRPIPEQWLSEPSPDGMADGVACIVDRLAATGNGQVPAVAAMAWRILDAQLTANEKLSD